MNGFQRDVTLDVMMRARTIAEYAVMLAVILVLVVGTIRLVGSNANNVFSRRPVRSSNPRKGVVRDGRPEAEKLH